MFAVIMAGGSGTRFWPASRESLPKQFLPITSDRTLFEDTVDRVRPLTPESNIYAVVNRRHAELTRRLFSQDESQVLIEPVARNTAPAIGLAAIHAGRQDQDEPMIVLPSDHFIAHVEDFGAVLKSAAEVARTGAIVTLGVTPTHPETGYGYIQVGSENGAAAGRPYFKVERFVEKPVAATALEYLAGKKHLWNSGIFIFTPKTILTEIQQTLPDLYKALGQIEQAIGRDDYDQVLEEIYHGLKPVSIDYGVLEKTKAPIYVLRADFGWSDVGSWQALYELRAENYDQGKNLLIGDAIAIEAERNLVYSNSGRLISLLGVKNLVVVDTPDALLITDKDRSQEVKRVPETLKKSGRDSLT